MPTLTVDKVEKKELEPRDIAPFRTEYFENPFSLMRRFSQEMDRVFEDFGFRPRFFETPIETGVWSPDVEVLEKGGQFIVRADLPGLTKEEVKVGVTDDVLTLEGERKTVKEEKREGYFRSERNYGAFYRAIPLPEGVKTDAIVANFKNGVLEVTMPLLKEEKKVKTIEVKQM
ncbi:MAG TPA: Hsp20/alpha crystallin family protein [Vicinamibacterales bacterium]|nr:Hsp20/alpha crystallin family protein [Vicinamibacterales bacterium]